MISIILFSGSLNAGASFAIMEIKLANKLAMVAMEDGDGDARNDLLNLTIGDLKLANKFPEAMEEDGEAFGILAIEAMEEASSTIMDLKLANKLVEGRNEKLNPK